MIITHAGLVAVVGRPNAGKSTLVNKMLGEKVSIVSPKPQTTRHKICAVLSENSAQVVLIDTPGFHHPRTRLGELMAKAAVDSVSGTDAALLVVEPVASVGTLEAELIAQLKKRACPAFLVINKTDTVEKAALLPVIDAYRSAFDFADIFPVSARTGDGVGIVRDTLFGLMPEGAALFPEGMTTDQTDRLLVAELVREQILRQMREEVPHGVAVVTETLNERPDGLVDISVTIYCEQDNHKSMLIGKGGSRLKSLGEAARRELEEIYEGKVNLQTWVKVDKNWRDKISALQRFGYR